MKRIKYIFIAVLIMSVCGCKRPSTHTQVDSSGIEREFNEVTIEGCEYLTGYRKMAHKGNCSNPMHKYN
jgi:hypothetical protein